jgi:acyl-CoA synthetase (AMP-forming)/AMP-acid ligase II
MPELTCTPTVPAWLRQLTEMFGDREMIVQDERRVSYADAEARSAELALDLVRRGLGKASRVGLLFPNGVDWLVAWLATARIGAVAVPINTFFQARELGWVLRHADVQVLLTVPSFLGNDYLERLEAAAPGLAGGKTAPLHLGALPCLREVVVWSDEAPAWATRRADVETAGALDRDFLRALEDTVAPADTLLTLYSSGSTADPKGALHCHGSVIRHSHALWSFGDLGPNDRVWSPMPFFWVGGLAFALLGNMHAGACTLCESVFDPEQTLRFLERERATVAIGWPHFGKALADHPSRVERDLSGLRRGNLPDILPEEVCPADPELRATALGMTETCGPHTWASGKLPEAERGTFGRPVPGVEHKVVDPVTGETLSPGASGEICVRGYSLMQGLHKVPRDEVFDADGFYHTGDGGFFDARGLLHFEGRLGEMIKSGGANVTPSEVEAVLLGCPEVAEAYVVGVPDADRGELVAAAVVLEPGASAEAAELRARVKGELAAYKVPRLLHVAEPGTLPFTDSGKIDKRRLREQLAARTT